ncbi:MAG: fibro-slime domain-containing protein [Dorea sp.]|nr:fibro-slime domain-containing protein [Dorea sp.]
MKMRRWCRKALALTASFLFAVLLFAVPAYAAGANKGMSGRAAAFGIYFPVTIRDYAADGMLFEWNDFEETGTKKINGKTVHQGNNDGFSLLTTTEASHQNVLNATTLEGSTVQTWGQASAATPSAPKVITLPNGNKETIYGGTFRTSLVEPVLGPDKKLVYRQETVDFLADYLSRTLPENYQNKDGSVNLWYVMGSEMEELGGKQLAQVLREQIHTEEAAASHMGSYQATKTKAEAGALESVYDVTSYYDAAYFLLNNLFCDNVAYGSTQDYYDNIYLQENLSDSGNRVFAFFSGYTNTSYDRFSRTITNTQMTQINSQGSAYGFAVPEDVFDPINGLGYGNQNSPYQIFLGGDSTDQVNHNLSVESHGKFVYHETDQLYFNFMGDGDVYLYINGILSLDMGAAQTISKAGIELNALADRLGLVDGEMYDLDFFYVDRQGRNANFGMETNIRLMSPYIATDIKVFQNQTEVGYGGMIDPDQPVTYQYSLENTGDKPVYNLSFDDLSTQIFLDRSGIFLNDFTSMEDLYIERRNEDGSADLKLTGPTEQELKDLLEEGLKPGQKLIVYGIQYEVADFEWFYHQAFLREVFGTTLRTAADLNLPSGELCMLHGYANSLICKSSYTFAKNHYYDWGQLKNILTEEEKDPDVLVGRDGKYSLEGSSAGVTMTRKELLQTAVDAGAISQNTYSTEYRNAKIQICSPAGNTQVSNNLNAHVKVKSDGSVSYQTETSGVDTFYYQVISGNKKVGPIAVTVYTYGVADNTYVLDYGLQVELYNDEEAGFTKNDLLSLASVNPVETRVSLVGIQKNTNNYGTFSQNSHSLIYQPKKMMNGKDQTEVKIQILEKGAKALTSKTGVVLTQKLTIVPANVVYYEDTFEGITYISEDGNAWAMYEGFDENGNSTASAFQSPDQEGPYGSDPNYQLDHEGRLTLVEDVDGDGKSDLTDAELDLYEDTITGDASNDTIHVLNVQETKDVLSFTFAGTGFEIVSRTTSEDYCVLSVTVTDTRTGQVEKQFPVITECTNGDLYQVPIIKVNNLAYSTYQVTLRAAKSRTTKENGRERILYIDGVRIYEPLNHLDQELYYNHEESDAAFYEVKELLEKGQAVVVTQGSDKRIRSGSTYIEDVDPYGFILKETSDPDEYLNYGPNNELYLNSAAQNSALVVWLEEIPDQEKLIQIGAHRKSDESTGSYGAVNLVYGSTLDELEKDANVRQIESGTESYYQLDEKLLKKYEDGLILMIGTTESENEDEILSLTNLKLSGYQIKSMLQSFSSKIALPNSVDEKEEAAFAKKGIEVLKTELYQMLQTKKSDQEMAAEEENQTEEGTSSLPQKEASLILESLKFKNPKVNSGKTATLLVVTDLNTENIHVLRQDGSEVELSKVLVKEKDAKKTHTISWKVEEDPGQEMIYTVYGSNQSGDYSEQEEITLKIQ